MFEEGVQFGRINFHAPLAMMDNFRPIQYNVASYPWIPETKFTVINFVFHTRRGKKYIYTYKSM